MENRPDRCYFCGTLSQYNFAMETAVCSHHWDRMYKVSVPKYVPNSQILTYKKTALLKKIKGKL